MTEKKRKIVFGMIFLMSIFLVGIISASWCCEKTVAVPGGTGGVWCSPEEDEASCNTIDFSAVPTSCEATSYCRLGTCIDSNDGYCYPNTPQRACEAEGGTWDERPEVDSVPQCELGCCLIGEQASIVTSIRCEKVASESGGLDFDYKEDITDISECIANANPSDKGACVFINDRGQRDCDMTTREACLEMEITPTTEETSGLDLGGIFGSGDEDESEPGLTELGLSFYKDFLCSAEELNTICGAPGKSGFETKCGKDGKVYFLDTCGNFANVYDSSTIYEDSDGKWKVKSDESSRDYWTKIKDPLTSCVTLNAEGTTILGNKNSPNCGDCEAIQSVCKEKKVGEAVNYGDLICRDLDCLGYVNVDEGFTTDPRIYPKHAETWCAKSPGVGLITATEAETGTTFSGGDDVLTNNLPGSDYFLKKCYNGEVLTEICGTGFRSEICVQSDQDETEEGVFWGAVCKKPESIGCMFQNNSEDCEDRSERDCKWMPTGYYFSPSGGLRNKTETEESKNDNKIPDGICVPRYPFAFDIYSDNSERNGGTICPLAKSICIVTYELPVGGGAFTKNISDLTPEEKRERCVHNCHCLPRIQSEIDAGQQEWGTTMNSMCVALGDCGNKNNMINRPGEQTEVVFIEAAPTTETTE